MFKVKERFGSTHNSADHPPPDVVSGKQRVASSEDPPRAIACRTEPSSTPAATTTPTTPVATATATSVATATATSAARQTLLC